MITQKKITIPIFNYKLTIVIFDKWKECDKFLPADEMETEANAITIHNYGASLVALSFCLLYKYYTCLFKVIYLLYCRQIKFYLSLHLFKITLRREVYGRRT